jgi:hypothetical protein
MSLPSKALMTIAAAAIGLPVAAAMLPPPQAEMQVQHNVSLTRLDLQLRDGNRQDPDDPYCDTPEAVGISLVEDYAEKQQFSVWGEGQARLDFWAAAHSRTWTVVYTPSEDVSCVAASGTDWDGSTSPGAIARMVGFHG